MSVVFAAGASFAFYLSTGAGHWNRTGWFLLAAACIQLRLLCNLIDGMVAVEGGLQTKSGEVFNEFPDRISDTIILISVGYASLRSSYLLFSGPILGWSAAILAMLTAYVRLLGGAAGLKQEFTGPMAKPHRMAVLTIAALIAPFELAIVPPGTTLWLSLAIINVGCMATTWRRLARIVRGLEER